MKIIGLSGKRGVGKTTLADYLSAAHKFVQVSFADSLRDIAKTLFPFDLKDLSDPRVKERPYGVYDWTPREFLINLGEFMRYHDKNYWLTKGLSRCSANETYVFDDVRYVNEADCIRSTGYGYIVRINRYEKDNPYGKNLDIPSESQLDDYKFDYVVEHCQNTTLTSLYRQGDILFNKFVKDI